MKVNINDFFSFFASGLSICVVVVFALQLLFMAWWPLHSDLFFYSDVSRDFLLMREMVEQKKPDLIGARAGGVPGFFHGPLWLYINLPVFILSGGNPVVQAWYWYALAIVGLLSVWWIVKKWGFSQVDTLLLLTMLAAGLISFSGNALNWYGAVLCFPIFFYAYSKLLRENKVKDAVLSGLCLGAIVQFQVATGAPLFLLSVILLLLKIIRFKKLQHVFTLVLLLIFFCVFMLPYFLFEARHDWLQTRSIFDSLSSTKVGSESPTHFLTARVEPMVWYAIRAVTPTESNLLFVLTACVHLFLLVLAAWVSRKKTVEHREILLLFVYFYFGFWILAIFYPGSIQPYYSWPLSMWLIPVCWIALKRMHMQLGMVIAAVIIFAQLVSNIKTTQQLTFFKGIDVSSWSFQTQLADDVIELADNDSAIFFFTSDQYGYIPKYAVLYQQDKAASHKFSSFIQKRNSSILVYFPEDLSNAWWNHRSWKQEKLYINSMPVTRKTYSNGVQLEVYQLNDTELSEPVDPTIITDLRFR